MTSGCALLLVGVAFVVHIVQQSHRLPWVSVSALEQREMPHRVRDSVAMAPQTFRCDPFVQNVKSAIGQCSHSSLLCLVRRAEVILFNVDTFPKSDASFNFFGGVLWFGIIPSGVLIHLLAYYNMVITGLSFPRTASMRFT